MDGQTHINIYSKGNTELGRQLSNFYHSPIVTLDGVFESVEGYWYWLGCRHPNRNKLMLAYGYEAKKLGKELGGKDWNNDPHFKMKIATIIIQKLMQHPNILQNFLSNQLPYRHYYVYGSKVVEPEEGKWIVDIFTFLQKLLQS